MANGWIGVDLDGTLAHHDESTQPGQIGKPIAVMLERVKGWLAEGREVRIVTARANEKFEVACVQEWCLTHFGKALPVTASKDYAMLELWDDRAVQVVPNVGLRLDEMYAGYGKLAESGVTPLKELERREIRKAMKMTRGSVAQAAKLLGIGRATLYRRLAELELLIKEPEATHATG